MICFTRYIIGKVKMINCIKYFKVFQPLIQHWPIPCLRLDRAFLLNEGHSVMQIPPIQTWERLSYECFTVSETFHQSALNYTRTTQKAPRKTPGFLTISLTLSTNFTQNVSMYGKSYSESVCDYEHRNQEYFLLEQRT